MTVGDCNARFGDMKMLGEQRDYFLIGGAIVRGGMSINCQKIVSGRNNFFLAGARLNEDRVTQICSYWKKAR